MTLRNIIEALSLEVKSGQDRIDTEVTGGYAGDMLSHVLANGEPGNVWVTLQTHANVVAVADAKDIAGIILVQGRCPDENTLRKAHDIGIPVMISRWSTYETVGKLSELGVRGNAGV